MLCPHAPHPCDGHSKLLFIHPSHYPQDEFSREQEEGFHHFSLHMTVVILVYGAAIYTYMLPISYHTPEKDMAVSAFHIILTPVLNPLIYSLRNKDVTGALKKILNVGLSFRKL